jgi:hypothetical protein
MHNPRCHGLQVQQLIMMGVEQLDAIKHNFVQEVTRCV